ncbi:MAG: M23 family metallopeptidase [Candidatus Marinimicrobia bacterium]|nr:M23 family metallopeptidase [Candidatus Neomarinimicrobiota bacterium]
MKPSKYTVLLIPDNETEGRSFSFNRSWFYIFVIIAISFISFIFLAGYFLIPKATEYQKMKKDYNKLVMERVKVMELFQDLQRLQQMDEFLRKNLGSEVDLSSFQNGLDSLSKTSMIHNRNNNYSTNQIINIPTKAPIDGYITQRMIMRPHIWKSNHYGIDISVKEGDPVVASASGLVIFSGWSTDLGNMIIIYHGNDYFTFYGHNQVNLVDKRDIVNRGDVISLAGNTGISSGPHLHFEVWEGSNPLDPLNFFPEYNEKNLSVE